jgi:hypothetical protein
MERIIENMRKETREGYLKFILNGSWGQAEKEWANLLTKYTSHPDYLDEYKRILEAAKKGESIQDYPIKRRKEFFQMRRAIPKHIKDTLLDLETAITHSRF